jgi:hypothetical protein
LQLRSLGKAAIHRLVRESEAVRDVVAAFVPEYRAKEAACMAAFYADASPVSRRFEWDGSTELEALGTENGCGANLGSRTEQGL